MNADIFAWFFTSIGIDPGGSGIFLASKFDPAAGRAAYLKKFSPNGEVLWAAKADVSSSGAMIAGDAVRTGAGGTVMPRFLGKPVIDLSASISVICGTR